MICPHCGNDRMRLTDEPIVMKYRGEQVTVDSIKHWQCDECGDYEMGLREADERARGARAAWTNKHGYDLLTPREIRKIRRSLGMTQQEFERAVGVSSPTVSRWENGKVTQTRTADLLMRRLARDGRNKVPPTFALIDGGSVAGTTYRTAPDSDNHFALEG